MSKWRDIYKVHPAADMAPMMEDEALVRLGDDIKANALKYDIVMWRDIDGQWWLIDGRNRLEAMERAGVPLDPSRTWHVTCGDPYSWVLTLNAYRRHQTKQELADLIVKLERGRAEAEKGCKVCTVSAEPHKGGRGKVKPIKQRAIIIGKDHGIGKRTMQTALAKAEGKEPVAKPKRRTNEQIKLDKIENAIIILEHIAESMDRILDPELLTPEQRKTLRSVARKIEAYGRTEAWPHD